MKLIKIKHSRFISSNVTCSWLDILVGYLRIQVVLVADSLALMNFSVLKAECFIFEHNYRYNYPTESIHYTPYT